MENTKTYTTEELNVYTTIVLRYYNYWLSQFAESEYYTDDSIKLFSEWYSKFVFDGDLRTVVKEFNQQSIDDLKQQENEEYI